MFKKIQFPRIKVVSDYVLRKLKEGNVVLGIYVSENEITSVDSFWLTNKSTIHKYTLYPILNDDEGATLAEGEFVDIRSEEDDYPTYKEFKSFFRYKPIAYINAANMDEKQHEHWFYSDDKENAWGPLETNLVEHFVSLYPDCKIYSNSQQKQDDFNFDKSIALECGFSNEVAEYMVNNLPGFFRNDSDLHKWTVYLKNILGINFAEILNESFRSEDDALFKLYFDVENIERALGFRK